MVGGAKCLPPWLFKERAFFNSDATTVFLSSRGVQRTKKFSNPPQDRKVMNTLVIGAVMGVWRPWRRLAPLPFLLLLPPYPHEFSTATLIADMGIVGCTRGLTWLGPALHSMSERGGQIGCSPCSERTLGS